MSTEEVQNLLEKYEQLDVNSSSYDGRNNSDSSEEDSSQTKSVKEEQGYCVDTKKMVYIMHNLQSFTTAQLRDILRNESLNLLGDKKTLKERVKRFYKKPFTLHKLSLDKLDSKTKTSRYFEYLVVIDFECTCTALNNDFSHEIIEFPAVLIDVRTLKIVDTFQSYVKPVLNPKLDKFCIELCGIQQETVENAACFLEVHERFLTWMTLHKLDQSSRRYAFVTDGPHDFWKFLQFQFQLCDKPLPHKFRHFIDMKRIFENKVERLPRRNGKTGIENMLDVYDMKFEGRLHSGLDDAVNIARICIRMMEDDIELKINQKLVPKASYDRPKANSKSETHEVISDYHLWKNKLHLKLSPAY